MPKEKQMLFISSSIGLGHVVRDLAIAERLRSEYPRMRIRWLAGEPAETGMENIGTDDPAGIEIKSFVPDLCIVQAGGMTTAELSAVQTPFLYVPLEGHSEQEQHIHQKMKREGAGKPLNFRETGPADLAEIIVRNLEEGGTPETMQDRGAPHLKRFNGAEKAAEAILREI